jgi:hypothetical protein
MQPERPGYDYQFAAELGLKPEHLKPEVWLNLKAVELAIIALEEDPWFEAQFGQNRRTINDVIVGVKDLDDVLKAVVENCHGRKKAQRIQEWGQRILRYAQNGGIDNGMNGYHQKAAEFVFANKDVFRVEVTS